jgi:hypothetical protein
MFLDRETYYNFLELAHQTKIKRHQIMMPKLHIFWNILHKPRHNNRKIIINFFFEIFEIFLKNILKNVLPKTIPKASGCGSGYSICIPTNLYN